MLNITPLLIRYICAFKNWSSADFYYNMRIDECYTISYFYKILKGLKPLNDDVKIVLNNKINEVLTTEELIKVLKVQEYLK